MDIKLVNKEDYDKIYTFVEEAFKTAEVSDGTEQDFVLELRKSSNYVPELEFAAYDKNILIGHIMLTKQNLKSNKPVKAVLVAPLSVKKEYRSRGVNCTPKVRLLEVQFFHEQILRRIQNQSSTNGFRR